MPKHDDHATWVSFTADEMAQLRRLVGYGVISQEAHARLLERLDTYESPAAKDPVFRAAAEDLDWVRDGECEIDDYAVVSGSDEGAYVMAWVWVSNADAGIEDDEEESEDGEV